jgi:hypothetical protein
MLIEAFDAKDQVPGLCSGMSRIRECYVHCNIGQIFLNGLFLIKYLIIFEIKENLLVVC